MPLALPVRRRRAALFLLFLVTGVAMASWVTRTPAIRDATGVSTAGMGLIIFGLSVGSMLGVLSSGTLVARFGARPVTAAGVVLLVIGLGVLALGTTLGSGLLVSLGLAFFGASCGAQEIAINVEGAAVEQVVERPVLPALHGCFSGGTVVGAGLGIGMTALAFPLGWHFLLVAALVAGSGVWALRQLPAATGKEGTSDQDPSLTACERLAVWREPRVVMLCLLVLGLALAEGSANDWLPLIAVDGYGLDAVAGSVAFTVFAAWMTIGRFSGGYLLGRFGRVRIMRAGTALAALGILGVVFAPTPALGIASVVLWGLGTSLGFPVALSAAGDEPKGAAARVSAVATAGYLAFLCGPPALGFVGEAVGLRYAMLVVLAFVVLAGACAGVVRSPAGQVLRTHLPAGAPGADAPAGTPESSSPPAGKLPSARD